MLHVFQISVRRIFPIAFGCAALISFCVLPGCASPGEKMVQSYQTTREVLTKSQGHVDAALNSLVLLRRSPADLLKDSFERYEDQVDELEHDAEQSKYRAQAMANEQEAHIKAWQNEMASINDPAIKSTLESRRQAAKSNYKLVRMYADDVRNAYGPFLKRNKDLVQALSIDLSPAALTSLSPSIDQTTADGTMLKQKIGLMQHAMDNIANGVSAIGLE